VQANRPAELFCLDTFYIGKLKGVGKVWQISACAAASSYGVARILPTLSAAVVAQFLRGSSCRWFSAPDGRCGGC
jgi:hypothetical protein